MPARAFRIRQRLRELNAGAGYNFKLCKMLCVMSHSHGYRPLLERKGILHIQLRWYDHNWHI